MRTNSDGKNASPRYELVRGDTVLGVVTLDPDESDFPWFVGRLEPSPAYAAVEPQFAEMNRLLDRDGFDEESGELHERIMEPGIRVRSLPDGELTEVVGINIKGRRVSWRI
jgi:hypothetical protein